MLTLNLAYVIVPERAYFVTAVTKYAHPTPSVFSSNVFMKMFVFRSIQQFLYLGDH